MTQINEIKIKVEDLEQFRGTAIYYQYSPLFSNFRLTEGTKFLVLKGECYWLFDKIAALQIKPEIKNHPELRVLQFWNLKVREVEGVRKATLICEWDQGKTVHQEEICQTDFPLDEVNIWVGKTTGV